MKINEMVATIRTMKRVGKDVHAEIETPLGNVSTVIDLQEVGGLTDEETVELVSLLDAKEKSKE